MTPTQATKQVAIPLNGEPPQTAVAIVRPTPTSVLLKAVESGANVDTLAKLLELQERWEANEARKAFKQAFADFKAEAPRLEKTKTVGYDAKNGGGRTSYKFTPLDVIANTLGPILAKHGLSYNWRQECSKEGIIVTCILQHIQGHSTENALGPAAPDTTGSKNAIQAIGSAVTYLRRYTLLGVLGMATSDDDSDGMTMGSAADFVANIQTAGDMRELVVRYKEAVTQALQAKDPAAVKVFMQAREKREKELNA